MHINIECRGTRASGVKVTDDKGNPIPFVRAVHIEAGLPLTAVITPTELNVKSVNGVLDRRYLDRTRAILNSFGYEIVTKK